MGQSFFVEVTAKFPQGQWTQKHCVVNRLCFKHGNMSYMIFNMVICHFVTVTKISNCNLEKTGIKLCFCQSPPTSLWTVYSSCVLWWRRSASKVSLRRHNEGHRWCPRCFSDTSTMPQCVWMCETKSRQRLIGAPVILIVNVLWIQPNRTTFNILNVLEGFPIEMDLLISRWGSTPWKGNDFWYVNWQSPHRKTPGRLPVGFEPMSFMQCANHWATIANFNTF